MCSQHLPDEEVQLSAWDTLALLTGDSGKACDEAVGGRK